jgi:hypothetical protein
MWARNFYPVPIAHIGARVDLRVTDTVLEICRGDERLTSHLLLASSPSRSRSKARTRRWPSCR